MSYSETGPGSFRALQKVPTKLAKGGALTTFIENPDWSLHTQDFRRKAAEVV